MQLAWLLVAEVSLEVWLGCVLGERKGGRDRTGQDDAIFIPFSVPKKRRDAAHWAPSLQSMTELQKLLE